MRPLSVATAALLLCAPVLAQTSAVTWQENVVHSFASPSVVAPTAIGSVPLIQAPDGNIWGMATYGGANAAGQVFNTTLDGTYSGMHDFSSTDAAGYYPMGIVTGLDGNLYGVTSAGAVNGTGSFFRIAESGALTVLATFPATLGSGPAAPPIQQITGQWVGTALNGGANGLGYIWTYDPVNGFAIKYSCTITDCAAPQGLLQGADGDIYGVSASGGSAANGAIFLLDSAFTMHVPFQCEFVLSCSKLVGAPVQAKDGNIYVQSGLGLSFLVGGIVRVTPGAPTTTFASTLFPFSSISSLEQGEPTGGSLIVAGDDNLYGANTALNTAGYGAAYLMQPAASSVFDTIWDSAGSTDTIQPAAGLLEATDGSLWGLALHGGEYGTGTLFKLVPSTPLPALLSVVPSGTTAKIGDVVSVAFSNPHAYSTTAEQCLASATNQAGALLNAAVTETYTFLSLGQKTFTLSCGGNVSVSANTTIQSADSAITLTPASGTATIGTISSVTANVTSPSGLTVDEGAVTLTCNGRTIATANVQDGSAVLQAPASTAMVAGTYNCKASFADSDPGLFSGSSVSTTYVLKAQSSSVTFAPVADTYIGASITMNPTVTGQYFTPQSGTVSITATPYGGSHVYNLETLKISASSNSPSATFTVPSAPYGKYTVTATFSGDAYTAASSSSVIVTLGPKP